VTLKTFGEFKPPKKPFPVASSVVIGGASDSTVNVQIVCIHGLFFDVVMADDICVHVVLVIWCMELSYFINQRVRPPLWPTSDKQAIFRSGI